MTGRINYTTGQVDITFSTPPAKGTPIQVDYVLDDYSAVDRLADIVREEKRCLPCWSFEPFDMVTDPAVEGAVPKCPE